MWWLAQCEAAPEGAIFLLCPADRIPYRSGEDIAREAAIQSVRFEARGLTQGVARWRLTSLSAKGGS
jgi:hypothetical protein